MTCENTEVARHRRCWADHQSITDPVHKAAATAMRQARRLVAVPETDTGVAQRDLADYDRLFGLDDLNEQLSGQLSEGIA